jgi:hypothetical protein
MEGRSLRLHIPARAGRSRHDSGRVRGFEIQPQQAKNMPNWSLYNIDHSSFRVDGQPRNLTAASLVYIRYR